jgi:galactose mutarotase-like enzyme
MTNKILVLTDTQQQIYVDSCDLGNAQEPAGKTGGSLCVRKRRLHGGRQDGVDTIEVDNGALRFVVLPTRGMGLWKAWSGPLEIGWQSPIKGPIHPSLVNLFEPSGIGWLAGFDELLCRCGLESNGAPQFDGSGRLVYPLHGRIANQPAHRVEVAIDEAEREIAVTGWVDEARLFGNPLRLRSTYRARAGQQRLVIEDEVSNPSSEPAELELLYHINFGHPLLAPGARVEAAIQRLAPRDQHSAQDVTSWQDYAPAKPGSREFVHFASLHGDESGRTRVLLAMPDGRQGVSLQFNVRQLPCFTLWKSQLAPSDGYVTGLEPGINYPNVRDFEKSHGRVATLEPGQSRSFTLTLEVHPDAASVGKAREDVIQLRQGRAPLIERQPHADWSP